MRSGTRELTEMYEAQAVRLDEAMKGFVVQGQRTGTIPPDVVAAEVSRLVRAVVYSFALIGAGVIPDELNRVADLFRVAGARCKDPVAR